MLRHFGKVSVLAILSAAAFAAGGGCSSGDGAQNASGSSQSPANSSSGSISLALQAGGITFDSVSYSISGPGGFATSGTVNVAASSVIGATIGGLPAGSGYTITLSALSVDKTETCLGSANFNVTAAATTSVTVTLACHTPATTGSVNANGILALCPTISAVSAAPNSVTTGSSVAVSAASANTSPDASAVSYQWSAPSGTFANAASASTTYTCTQPGTVTLSVAASNGTAACNTSSTVQVSCTGHLDLAAELATVTPIKHLVVIFNENISYDHYFATYPVAQNNAGEPTFTAAGGTSNSNNLATPLDPTNGFAPLSVNLLTNNPNLNAANGAGATNPFRLGPSQANTSDQGHNYKPEQEASDNGLMDLFPKYTGTAGPPPGSPAIADTTGLVLAYFDGNTVSTLWNLAQSYALNDNTWTTTFGPSTPGAINLISGQTNGIVASSKALSTFSTNHVTPDGQGGYTLIGDTDPLNDQCSTSTEQTQFGGKNIGDLLNAQKISWGWFEGGFNLGVVNSNGTTGCNRETNPTPPNPASTSTDYIPHHAPFQYYASTANPSHTRPSSVAAIGSSLETDNATPEPANHQYDSLDFFTALAAGNLPAVVYLKAPAYQDGHAGYSNPIDEGNFIASVMTALQGTQEWASTAVVITYDDSDGWYDHQAPPIVNPSTGVADFLNGSGQCVSGAQQTGAAPATPLLGLNGQPVLGRCGYGTRVPLLVVSPFAKKNIIDHTLLDQTSVLRFVEDNWLGGERIQPGGSFDTIANSLLSMLNF